MSAKKSQIDIRAALLEKFQGYANSYADYIEGMDEVFGNLPDPKAMAASLPGATPTKALKAPKAAKEATQTRNGNVLKPVKTKAAKAPKAAKEPKSGRSMPTVPERLAIVMGTKTMGTKDLIPLVEARGWAPDSKNGLGQYFSVVLSSNSGDGKIFERVSTGQYKVQNPSQFTALAKQYGGKTSGKAGRVTAVSTDDSEDSEVSGPHDTETDMALEALLSGTEFEEDGSSPLEG